MDSTQLDNTPLDWLLVLRYLAGEATSIEREAVDRWIAASPEHAQRLEAVRATLRPDDPGAPGPVDIDGGWRKVRQVVRRDAGGTAEPYAIGPDRGRRERRQRDSGWPSGGRGKPRHYTVWAVASMLVALGAGTAVGVVRHQARTVVAWREYGTPAGGRETVTFADGSLVTLAPASRVRVPVDYAAGDRRVMLDGEAVFAVVHDARHPFVVRAGGAIITDIGTRFDVRAYAGDSGTRVAVAEGRVSVAVGDANVNRAAVREGRLQRGDVAVVDGASVTITHRVDVGALTAWTEGDLVYRDAPAKTVVADLGRWYAMNLVVGDTALGARPVTATFAHGESADAVLSMLCGLLGAHAEQQGDRVTIVANSRRAGG